MDNWTYYESEQEQIQSSGIGTDHEATPRSCTTGQGVVQHLSSRLNSQSSSGRHNEHPRGSTWLLNDEKRMTIDLTGNIWNFIYMKWYLLGV